MKTENVSVVSSI